MQGHSHIENAKIPVSTLSNFTVDLDEIQYVSTTYWFVRVLAKFILHKKYSREVTTLT